MADQKIIQIRFTKVYKKDTKSPIEYQDALNFTEDEYNLLDTLAIEDMKQKRFDNFVSIIENPPIPVNPTKEELQSQADELQRQLDEVNLKIAEIGGVLRRQ